MKALPKTELFGNMSHCCSVAVVVSRVHQEFPFNSETQTRQHDKVLQRSHEGNVYLLHFRVAFCRAKENFSQHHHRKKKVS